MSFANDLSSFGATIIRLGRGISPRVTRGERADLAQLLELYDFEGCPYCRKVREALCELDLDYFAHPVAHGSARAQKLIELGGKRQVPYLIDPNTGTRLYESDEIIDYLNETYAEGRPAGWSLPVPHVLDNVISFAASAARFGWGSRCRVDTSRTFKPLTLYNMEGSPYCRKVREALSELDLEHIVRNVPKGSPKRAELAKLGGKVQVPYLIDPNTRKSMYESDDIVAYLEKQYGPDARAANGRRHAG